jgi:hypothetical protein
MMVLAGPRQSARLHHLAASAQYCTPTPSAVRSRIQPPDTRADTAAEGLNSRAGSSRNRTRWTITRQCTERCTISTQSDSSVDAGTS